MFAPHPFSPPSVAATPGVLLLPGMDGGAVRHSHHRRKPPWRAVRGLLGIHGERPPVASHGEHAYSICSSLVIRIYCLFGSGVDPLMQIGTQQGYCCADMVPWLFVSRSVRTGQRSRPAGLLMCDATALRNDESARPREY